MGVGAANGDYFPAERLANHPQDTCRSSRKDGLGQHSTLAQVPNRGQVMGDDWMGRVQRQVGVLERAEWKGMSHFAKLRGVYHYREWSFCEFEDMDSYSTLHGRLFARKAPMSEHEAHHWTRQLVETQQELKKLRVYVGSWDLKDYLVDGSGTVKIADMNGGRHFHPYSQNILFHPYSQGTHNCRLITNEAADFIQTATATGPQERPTLNELLRHSWVLFPPPGAVASTLPPLCTGRARLRACDGMARTYFDWDGHHQDTHEGSRLSRNGLGRRSTLLCVDTANEEPGNAMQGVQLKTAAGVSSSKIHIPRVRRPPGVDYPAEPAHQLDEGGAVMTEKAASGWARELLERHRELKQMGQYFGYTHIDTQED
ncbi:unnamed protein product [Vitrella brassicaformis CCMP3155]|uniref:Protein kinase domain-containing protein n=1 Tax=Vitrella brassicaformis (strain CCMP3155) TaxID=1169540 RepID=A0A0G4EAZ3_VITBC|nr:unnamed protein product [Vitrella brassicaformis CCMP3155]|eukprot:CEL92623.1 unnamed protein product [Vitrella brassicaformis CCMP3155]